jgi:hypothetical protein
LILELISGYLIALQYLLIFKIIQAKMDNVKLDTGKVANFLVSSGADIQKISNSNYINNQFKNFKFAFINNHFHFFQAHLNGYNNGNAVSATANGISQMSVGQMQQQPIRVQNGPQQHLNGAPHMNGSGQMNGHHPVQQQQVLIRTPVPPAPAPSSVSVQPAPVTAVPPPPPRKFFVYIF